MERLSAPERTREELRALMNGELGTAAGRSDLVHLALRLIVEEALEGEVADALGRERYERGEGEKAGYRNGYRTGKVKTAEGAVDYSAPQVRETPEPFVSGVRAALSGRTQELERAGGRALRARAVDARHRGRVHRRAGQAASVAGGGERDHRAAVGRVRGFPQRDLSEHAIVYLFVDGIAERLRPGAAARGGSGRLGHRRGRAQGSAGVDGRFEGGRRDRAGLLPGLARQGPRRPAAGGFRRRAGDHPGDRGMLSPFGAPALPGAPCFKGPS